MIMGMAARMAEGGMGAAWGGHLQGARASTMPCLSLTQPCDILCLPQQVLAQPRAHWCLWDLRPLQPQRRQHGLQPQASSGSFASRWVFSI